MANNILCFIVISWRIHDTREPILGATWPQIIEENSRDEDDGFMIQLLVMNSSGCVLCWRVMNGGHLLDTPELVCKLESPFHQRTVCATKIRTVEGCFVAAGDVKGNIVVWMMNGQGGAVSLSGSFPVSFSSYCHLNTGSDPCTCE